MLADTGSVREGTEDESARLETYDIKRSRYQGLDIFQLKGGMSSEFAVQKSMTALSCGISHMWQQKDATGGPVPVMATPDFLQRSLRKTVDLYNEVIGKKTKVKTVIIGTGVPSVSYLSTTMAAVYLPIHFLAAAHTAGEIQAVLARANDSGYPSYGTLGYDGSMPGVGVAWIKLLDLPAEYWQFLVDHQVEEVILFGVGEKVIGESYARKVLSDKVTAEFGPGSLYVQYTNNGAAGDQQALAGRIRDFGTLKLADSRLIADWESGITGEQIARFSTAVKAVTKAKAYSLTADRDMIRLYDMAAGLVVRYIKKNEAGLTPPFIRGVAFNEYLVCHPQYEIQAGLVPLLYWQFVPAKATVERCFGTLERTVAAKYPDAAAHWPPGRFFLNSNYGKADLKNALIAKGVPASDITLREQGADIWNPSNGMDAPCEKFAEAIVNGMGAAKYVAKMKALVPLTSADVGSVCAMTGGLTFTAR